eukprot:Sdes_comp20791_c0_seq4m17004
MGAKSLDVDSSPESEYVDVQESLEDFVAITTPSGADTNGVQYESIEEMWKTQVCHRKNEWYGDANKYWNKIAPTVEGMLGGYSHISGTDTVGSTKFLSEFLKGSQPRMKSRRALDCGAGIGRVTKRLLLPLFDEVDLVEQNSTFLERAKDYVCSDRAKNFYCSGLQDFTPEKGRYDLIWCQWVLGHLTDEDMIEFFQRCKSGLSSGGFICVKENLTKEGFLVDKDDNSVTR